MSRINLASLIAKYINSSSTNNHNNVFYFVGCRMATILVQVAVGIDVLRLLIQSSMLSNNNRSSTAISCLFIGCDMFVYDC